MPTNKYQVFERPDGRVILDKESTKEDVVLQEISAPSWQEARKKVKDIDLYQDEGYGWKRR